MKQTLLLAALGLSLPAVASAQSLFVENFVYADSLAIGGKVSGNVDSVNVVTGWATHSGTIGQIKTGASFNQTFTSTPTYPSQSGAGIRLLASRGEDINHKFTPQVETATTTSIYVSAVVTPDAVPSTTTGSYFLHVAPSTLSSSSGGFAGRVFMAAGATAGTVRFGISTSGNVPVFDATEYTLGTKLLLVMRYDLVPGTSNNVARLYVLPQGVGIANEPVTANAVATDIGPDPASIGAVALRQGTTSAPGGNAGSMTIDGVRVGISWNDAPLPVELNAFTAISNGTTARLAWTTASETNNVGFGVEHLQGAAWVERGFAAGHGTTTERHEYAFEVAGLTAGRHSFRLRQTDTDGTTTYSPLASVEIGVAGDLTLTQLGGRGLRIQSERDADVSVYDLLGRQVMTQRVEPGTSEMRFDGLSAGVYVVRATAGAAATTLSVVVR